MLIYGFMYLTIPPQCFYNSYPSASLQLTFSLDCIQLFYVFIGLFLTLFNLIIVQFSKLIIIKIMQECYILNLNITNIAAQQCFIINQQNLQIFKYYPCITVLHQSFILQIIIILFSQIGIMSSNRQKTFTSVQNDGENQLIIPLMSKKMNSIEKYLSQFQHTSDVSTKAKKITTDQPNSARSSKFRSNLNHYQSAQITPYSTQNSKITPFDRFCIKYDSITTQKSQERIEVLSRLENDYELLKNKIHSSKISSFKIPGMARKQHVQTNQTNHSQIAPEDLQKQIKNTIINQNGRKYYADLYLLKKGRQQIINSLSQAGKTMLFNQGKSYQQRNCQRDNNFIKHKIQQQRQVKKYKMLKGRTLHWNVYYDMLALSSSQKKKISSVCKFNSTFGII